MKYEDAQKSIHYSDVLEILKKKSKGWKLTKAEFDNLDSYVRSMPKSKDGHVRLDQVLGLLSNYQLAIKHGDPEYLAMNRGFKVKRVPDVQEVIESKFFANQKANVWPSTLENLWAAHHGTPKELPPYFYRAPNNDGSPPCIICISGSAGGGKSETTWQSAFYTLVLMSLLYNPHVEYKHNPGSWIVYVMQSITQSTGKDSLFDKLQYAVDNSPYFRQHFPRRSDFNLELQWPQQRIKVVNLTGEWKTALGRDVFWAAMNEPNDMAIVERSKRVANTSKTTLDVAEEMYSTLTDRIETRFSEIGGGFPGKLWIDGQRSHTNDFTSKMLARAKKDPNILVIQKKLWEAKAHEYPKSEPRFLVELGDDFRPPRIIESRERAIDHDRVMDVPQRHYARFADDCEKACMDLAGEPTRSIGRFMDRPEKITNAQERYVKLCGDLRPFKFEEISFLDLFGIRTLNEPVDWGKLINYEYFDKKLDKSIAHAMHGDMALTGDAVGFAFGHVNGVVQVPLAHVWNKVDNVVQEMQDIEAPVYMIDGILRIVARPGEIIDPNLVQGLGFELKRLLNIAYGSVDWFEGMFMLLNWRKAEILADKYSVDTRPDGYFEYKHSMREDRLIMQPHAKNDWETRNLQRSVARAKIRVDHQSTGSKDTSDAVAGVLGVLSITEGPKYYRTVEQPEETSAFGEPQEPGTNHRARRNYRNMNLMTGDSTRSRMGF